MNAPGDCVTLRVEADRIVVPTTRLPDRILGGRSTPMRLDAHTTVAHRTHPMAAPVRTRLRVVNHLGNVALKVFRV